MSEKEFHFASYWINILDIAQSVSKEDAIDFLNQGKSRNLITQNQYDFIIRTINMTKEFSGIKEVKSVKKN